MRKGGQNVPVSKAQLPTEVIFGGKSARVAASTIHSGESCTRNSGIQALGII